MKTLALFGLLLNTIGLAGSARVIVETKTLPDGAGPDQTITFLFNGSKLRMHETRGENRSDDYLLYDSAEHMMYKVMPWSKRYLRLNPDQFLQKIVSVQRREMASLMRLEKQLREMGLARVLGAVNAELLPKQDVERVKATFDLSVDEIQYLRRYVRPLSLSQTKKRARMGGFFCSLFECYQDGAKQVSLWVTDWDATYLSPQEVESFKVVLQLLSHTLIDEETFLLWERNKLPFWGLGSLHGLPVLVVQYRNGKPVRQTKFSYQFSRSLVLQMLELPEGFKGSTMP